MSTFGLIFDTQWLIQITIGISFDAGQRNDKVSFADFALSN